MDGTADHLPDDVGALKAMIIAERLRSARLQHLLDVLNRMHFGKRSEKMAPDQLLLTFEDTDIAMGEVDLLQEQSAEWVEVAGGTRSKRRAPDEPRPSLPAHLVRHAIEIAPDVCACPGCGGALHRIGEDRAERLDIVPAQYRVLVTVRPKMGCRSCGDGVTQARAPKHIVPGGLPSEALLADVLVKKYADHLPLYRQAQIMARQGAGAQDGQDEDRLSLGDRPRRSCSWRRRPAGDRLYLHGRPGRNLGGEAPRRLSRYPAG